MLTQRKHINTPLGVVAVFKFSDNFPQGWERLNYQEAQPFLNQLK